MRREIRRGTLKGVLDHAGVSIEEFMPVLSDEGGLAGRLCSSAPPRITASESHGPHRASPPAGRDIFAPANEHFAESTFHRNGALRSAVQVSCLAAFLATVPSQAADVAGQAKVKVVGIMVVAPDGAKDQTRAYYWKTGVTVSAMVTPDSGKIIKVDDSNSKLDSFTDDKGTDLMVAPPSKDPFKKEARKKGLWPRGRTLQDWNRAKPLRFQKGAVVTPRGWNREIWVKCRPC